MFINDYQIPVNPEYQTLDAYDIAFMKEAKISEKTMKQIKGVSILLQKRETELEEGGSNV